VVARIDGLRLVQVNAAVRVGRKAARLRVRRKEDSEEANIMLDIGMIAMGVGFFAASILYVLACERM
jgi:hypothetical protein